MLRGFARNQSEKEKTSSSESPEKPWSVYILECSDGTFYTGITNNMARRLQQHNDKKGAKYTRTRTPVQLLYSEPCACRSDALIRECKVKALTRTAKKKLIDKAK